METLSPHLRALHELSESIRANDQYIPEKYPPHFSQDDPLLVSYKLTLTTYYFTQHTFIKRQNHPDEIGNNIYGDSIVVLLVPERLRNEAATLKLIAAETTIPVPTLLGIYEENGLVHLKTSLAPNDAILLDDVDPADQETAITEVDKQIQSTILPQLRDLRRNFVGSVDVNLPVIPTASLYSPRNHQAWPRMERDAEVYNLCHNDLGPHNIFVDPLTFEIVRVIDWEYAGFFPAKFEIPLWREADQRRRHQMMRDAKKSGLVGTDGLYHEAKYGLDHQAIPKGKFASFA
ncbi:hypothetical protein P152DRAFT_513907 [Eremomyces bilateralis CBS 781.70]|uniref:Aminoglycoside phosphotransferase domain-containing protein n=1 Tax=Eremomyces bilateralis CBS 781.70 TaxID=1392243 RepID=A0A6G1G4G3_9PEZI|nr:uncharacterized protein P152DRAFT_513907 [Eremomyces bilateralis CBS 781.70]KAF1812882.1 hypothetical protein P152DRAFT_513907 [Eremomyces bilateralis CBS 781.70]